MLRMVFLNIDKKMSFISVLFMLISIILIYIITIFNASFNLSEFQLLDAYQLVVENFLEESINLIEIISVMFVIFLVELDLFYNNDNFDCYFISIKGKKNYFIVKMISYLIIILFYIVVVFLGVGIIYLIRFKNIMYVHFIFSCFYHYLLYLIFYFLIAFMFLLIFKNYFSAMLVFVYYWLGKVIETNNNILLAIFPKIYLNIEERNVSFGNMNIIYIILYIVILYVINEKIYEYKDLKLIS